MSGHTFHPDSHTYGLADECPRCAEHADNPITSLDTRNLREIMVRAVDRSIQSRSHNEAIATANVLTALERAGRLMETDPEIATRYLRERWRVNI